MPKLSLDGIGDIIGGLSGGWKITGAIIALAALAISVGGGIKSGLQVPAKLDQHIVQQDSSNAIARRQLHEQQRTNCLLVAQLRHADWTGCLLPTVP